MHTAPENGRVGQSPLLVATGLLVIIVAAVGVMWLRQQRRAAAIERMWQGRYQKLERAYQSLQMLAAQRPMDPGGPLRDRLPARDATVDGKPRRVLLMSVAEAQRMGLQEGDVVRVTADAPPEPSEP